MDTQTLKAEKRNVFGRKVKSLRKEGILPANLYGKKIKSLALQVSLKDFTKVYEKAGETGLVELLLGKKDSKAKEKKTVLIHEVQVGPLSDIAIHADFLQVDLKEKVSAAVPIELVGESPAEKSGKGTLVQQLDEVQVEALPADLPEKFTVDVGKLDEVDETIQIKDLEFDKAKVEIEEDKKQIIVKIDPLRKEEEVAPPPTEEEEVAEEEAGEVEEEAKAEEPAEEKEEKGGKTEPKEEKGKPSGKGKA